MKGEPLERVITLLYALFLFLILDLLLCFFVPSFDLFDIIPFSLALIISLLSFSALLL